MLNRLRHTRHFLVAALCIPLLVDAVAVPPHAVYARNDVKVTDDEIDIAAHVDLVGGSDSLVKSWSKAIDKRWNRGFTYCGRKVQFFVDMQVANGGSVRPEADRVDVVPLRPGQYIRAHTRPNDKTWGSTSIDATVAHEFGHLVGLPDEYIDLPGQYEGAGANTSSVILPQYADDNSIMADHDGVVLPRHITDILRHDSKLARLYPCKWQGTIEVPTITGYHGPRPDQVCTGSWTGTFEFTVDAGWPPVDREGSPQPEDRPPGGKGGAIAGQGSAHTLGQPNCRFQGFPDADTAETFDLMGQEASGAYDIHPTLTGVTGGGRHDYDWFIFAFFNQTSVGDRNASYHIPVSGGSGSATFQKHVTDPRATGVGSDALITISLKRVSS